MFQKFDFLFGLMLAVDSRVLDFKIHIEIIRRRQLSIFDGSFPFEGGVHIASGFDCATFEGDLSFHKKSIVLCLFLFIL